MAGSALTGGSLVALASGLAIAGNRAFDVWEKRKNSKKVEAETHGLDAKTEVTLSDAAMRLLQPALDGAARAEKEAARANTRATAAEEAARQADERATRAESRIARLEQLGGLHMIWDQEAVEVVESLGGHLRPPPTLDDLEPSDAA